jgi:hypothetical protein
MPEAARSLLSIKVLVPTCSAMRRSSADSLS